MSQAQHGDITLSDSERFSCCAIQAVAMYQLFPTELDRAFCKESLENVMDYFSQTEQAKRMCRRYLSGEEHQEMLPFAQTLQPKEGLCWMSMADVIRHCLLAALMQGRYDARTRVLLKHLCVPLRVSWDHFEELEEAVVGLLQGQEKSKEAEAEGASRASSRKKKRFALIGLAAVGGGALIGLTGGLAAPFVAAGAGVLIGGSAAAIGTATGAALLGSVFGVAGAGLTGYKMRKRVGTVREFEFVPMATSRHLSVTIAVSGWIRSDTNDFFLPWKTLDISKEQYYLRWESQELKEMGQALDYLFSFVKTMAIQETLKLTILSGLLSAIAWPATLVAAASVLDNPWSVCLNRAEDAGHLMADLLLSREQGSRPVTLIGFSVGARVIFHCLRELARRKNDTQGIIEDVYLLGAPVSSNPKDWEPFCRVVAGKIVNCYSKTDWVLKFLFRTATASMSIAGLEPVKLEDRRMCNVDLTSIVNGHKEYFRQMDEILRLIGVRTKHALTRATSLQLPASKALPPPATSYSSSATFCRTEPLVEAEGEVESAAKAELPPDPAKLVAEPETRTELPLECKPEPENESETELAVKVKPECVVESEPEEKTVPVSDVAKRPPGVPPQLFLEPINSNADPLEEVLLQMDEISLTTSAVLLPPAEVALRRSSRSEPPRPKPSARLRRRTR